MKRERDPRRANPGSPEAVAHGCLCAIIDNHYGEGFPTRDGQRGWWITSTCELHARPRSAVWH